MIIKRYLPLLILALVIVALVYALSGCSFMNQQDHVHCVVKGKDIILDSNGDQGVKKTKRVTTTCGSFDVEDNLAGGFDSWDIWSQIEVGKTYDFKTGGYRIGFFSTFPYVLEVHER